MSTDHPQAILVIVLGLRDRPIYVITHGMKRGWRFQARVFELYPPELPGTALFLNGDHIRQDDLMG
eukprot:15667486-Heterocapsa_arctica.AAC.1